jgi:AraC family transcriptional regulator
MQSLHSVETAIAPSAVLATSGSAWEGFGVMTASLPGGALDFDGLTAHTLALNIGRPFHVEGRIDGRRASGMLAPAAMKLVEAGPRSAWRWDPATPIEMLHVFVEDALLRECAQELGARHAPEIATRVGFDDPALARLASALSAEIETSPDAMLVADALRIELIERIIAAYSSLAEREAVRLSAKRLGKQTLRLLDAYIDAHLAHEIRIGDLATLAGMSRFHFARIFRATVGSTPHQYVLRRRLERARALLRSPQIALRDIAAATGFADQSHLTRQLKRRYGVTPGALRAG